MPSAMSYHNNLIFAEVIFANIQETQNSLNLQPLKILCYTVIITYIYFLKIKIKGKQDKTDSIASS